MENLDARQQLGARVQDGLRGRVPAVHSEGGGEGADEGGARRGNSLADRYPQEGLEAEIAAGTNFETFFAQAPRLNPARGEIKGLICGQRVEEIQEPLTREIRYLDELVDELAKGKSVGNDSAQR